MSNEIMVSNYNLLDVIIYLISFGIILYYISYSWKTYIKTFNQKENFNDITSNGFIPNDVGKYSNNYLNPPITRITDDYNILNDIEQKPHYAMEDLNDIYPNPNLYKELPFKYSSDVKKYPRPKQWDCQRIWQRCSAYDTLDYWN